MLITGNEVLEIISKYKIVVNGVFHIGAHECEELSFYNSLGLTNDDVIWIDALDSKVEDAKNRGIPNVYKCVITDKDDKEVSFNVSNNNQSSSVLEFGTHSTEHSWVVYVNKIAEKSITVDTFFNRNNIDCSKYNFWNFDIQGAELMALKGAVKSIQHANILYLEVNEKELYKDCGLINEIDEFLQEYKFKRVLTNMTCHGWGDAIYIKEE
jgi:FkbM family methyltransferase